MTARELVVSALRAAVQGFEAACEGDSNDAIRDAAAIVAGIAGHAADLLEALAAEGNS